MIQDRYFISNNSSAFLANIGFPSGNSSNPFHSWATRLESNVGKLLGALSNHTLRKCLQTWQKLLVYSPSDVLTFCGGGLRFSPPVWKPFSIKRPQLDIHAINAPTRPNCGQTKKVYRSLHLEINVLVDRLCNKINHFMEPLLKFFDFNSSSLSINFVGFILSERFKIIDDEKILKLDGKSNQHSAFPHVNEVLKNEFPHSELCTFK